VAILTTGDEVVAPGEPLAPGQIHGSNGIALAALVRDAGAEPVLLGNVGDDPVALRAAFARAAAHDVVVSTGGVSVGDFDHVKDVFAELGGHVDFWRVAMKPGKPLAYGRIGSAPVFGLPGNPVSCMVNFLLFVRPVLRTMLGDPRPHLPTLDATLAGRPPVVGARLELVRVALARGDDGAVRATVAGPQGSASLLSMSGAHGLAILPPGAAPREGDPLRVLEFDPSWDARAHARYG
jgi:molybdopterin molybdotransferase